MDWTTIIVAIIGGAITLTGYVIVDKREKNKQLDAFKKEVVGTLNNHREEYLKGINEVKDNINEIKAVYQQNTAILELKINALEKKQDVHNNLISRMYSVEKDVEVLKNRESVSEHRLEDLEKK